MSLKPKTPEVLKRSKEPQEEPPTQVLPPAAPEAAEPKRAKPKKPRAKPDSQRAQAKPQRAAAKRAAGTRKAAAKPGGEAKKPRRAPILPQVKLGHVAANGVAPALYALIERGAARRSKVAQSLRGTVEVRFEEEFAPVRMVFDAQGALVEDDDGRPEGWEPDLIIEGSLPDIVQLAAAPLVGGVPKPTDKRGRAALARMADRRVRIDGSPLVARRLLKLLEI